jgi:hypothetical protein
VPASFLKYYIVKDRSKLSDSDRNQATILLVTFAHKLMKQDSLKDVGVQKQEKILRLIKEEHERGEMPWLNTKMKEIY